MKKLRIAAFVVAVTVVFVMLFSACFIIENTEHDCKGEDCRICLCLNLCTSLLKTFSAAFCISVIVSSFAALYYTEKSELASENHVTTPIILKVKLSD